MADQRLDYAERLQLDALRVNNQDLHGRKMQNASDGTLPQDYVTLSQLKIGLTELRKQLLTLINGINGSPRNGNARLYHLQHTLIADYTPTSPKTPVAEDLLWVFLTQDTTAGWQITWPSIFVGAGEEIYLDPGDTAMFLFAGTDDNVWQLLAEPVLRRNI